MLIQFGDKSENIDYEMVLSIKSRNGRLVILTSGSVIEIEPEISLEILWKNFGAMPSSTGMEYMIYLYEQLENLSHVKNIELRRMNGGSDSLNEEKDASS